MHWCTDAFILAAEIGACQKTGAGDNVPTRRGRQGPTALKSSALTIVLRLDTRRHPNRTTLTIEVKGEEPPREFRIFAAGENTTTKGRILFDEQAAADVMAAYEQHGVDLMIDLEHLSDRKSVV